VTHSQLFTPIHSSDSSPIVTIPKFLHEGNL